MPVVSVFCYPQNSNNTLHSTCSAPKSCQLATSRWTSCSTEQQKPFDHLTSICHVGVGRIVCCDGQKKSAALLASHSQHHSVTRCAAVPTTLDLSFFFFTRCSSSTCRVHEFSQMLFYCCIFSHRRGIKDYCFHEFMGTFPVLDNSWQKCIKQRREATTSCYIL